jgi:hypothetical protein
MKVVLHYLCNLKFDILNLKSMNMHNSNVISELEPDAQITIGEQKWAGNVEIPVHRTGMYHQRKGCGL